MRNQQREARLEKYVHQLMGQWRVKDRVRKTDWEISSTKQSLYLDGDYSHWSLENHITFPHLLKDSEGEGGEEGMRGQSLGDITFTHLLRRRGGGGTPQQTDTV